jgi:hypothetical protein
VGSYSYDMSRMVFEVATLGYIQTAAQSIVLDYQIFIRNLRYCQLSATLYLQSAPTALPTARCALPRSEFSTPLLMFTTRF